MKPHRAIALRVGAIGIAAAVCGIVPAFAQTQLPGIVVTTPSPVARPSIAPPVPSPVEPTAAPKQAAPQQAPAQTAAPAIAPQPAPSVALPPAGLIIVDDTFSTLTVVLPRDVLAQPGQTITDTLQRQPGIVGSTFAPGANRPIIRGLDSYRVRVQENGIGSGDVSTLSEDHAVSIDPYAARRIEIVRGPATLRYGSQAIGGVVAVENDRIPTVTPPRGFAVDLRGGLNSVDRGRDGAFSVTTGGGGVAIHADAHARRSFDYDTPQGRQANSFVDSEGASIGMSRVWANGFFGISYTRLESLYGIPGAEAVALRPRIDLVQDKVQAKGEWRVGDFGIEAIRVWFGTSRYAHNEVVFEEAEGRDIIGTRFTNREQEGRAEVQHLPIQTIFGELRGAAGIQAMRKKTAGFGVEEDVDGLLDPAARARSVAGFLFEELQVTNKLRLQGAVRLERAHTNGTAIVDADDPLSGTERRNRAFKPLSASAGMLYDLPLGVVARLTTQYTERAPDLGELYSKGVHEATGTFEIGNPNLAIEQARTIEFGFKRSKGAFRFDTSLFRTHYDGFIFKRLTGTECGDKLDTCGVETELDQVVFTQRDAVFQGVELAFELDVAPIWHGVWGIGGRYDLVRAQFEDGVNAPRIPPQRVGGSLFYRDRNWLARVGVLHALRQDAISLIDSKDTPTNGYTLVDAELAYTWRAGSSALAQEFTVGLRGDNLLDDDVRNHVSFKKDEVLQPGRTFRLFGSIKLD